MGSAETAVFPPTITTGKLCENGGCSSPRKKPRLVVVVIDTSHAFPQAVALGEAIGGMVQNVAQKVCNFGATGFIAAQLVKIVAVDTILAR